jgi:succinate-semialdehyde dehydrogenase/glutarate-semialdehyde dehydrogenase
LTLDDPMPRPSLTRDERLAALFALGAAIEARRGELIEGIVRTSRKIHRVAAGEVDLAIARLRAFGDVLPLLADREPVGTVAIVFPGNASISNPAATIGNAFLAGNRVVARFPAAARPWAEKVEPLFTAHLPGVRFDHGPGAEFLHAVLAAPEVAVVMVFGDDAWADPYEPLVRAARKKLIFEGPGKDPFLVLPTAWGRAGLERAAGDAVRGAYYNAGQACTSPERFYVHTDLLDEFLERVLALTRREVLGEPERLEATIGPIASRRVAARIAAQLEDAVARGARVLAGGRLEPGRLADGTEVTWVEPTVLAGADSSMAIMREETFGPVLAVQAVRSTAEALALAADSRYGLAANLYGGDDQAAESLAETHGQVFRDEIWLDYFQRHLHAPYGGRKHSGWVWAWEDERFVRREGARANAVEFSRSRRMPAG